MFKAKLVQLFLIKNTENYYSIVLWADDYSSTGNLSEQKIKVDEATGPPLQPAAEPAPWDQLEEAPKGCAQIGG